MAGIHRAHGAFGMACVLCGGGEHELGFGGLGSLGLRVEGIGFRG